jgi:hypothetical protein
MANAELLAVPTVSMGLGPLMAIYQARFLKWLHGRGLADTSNGMSGWFAVTAKWTSLKASAPLALLAVKSSTT